MINQLKAAFTAAAIERELPLIYASSLFAIGTILYWAYMAGRLLGLIEW